jgi:preprotein translocase subunit SecA
VDDVRRRSVQDLVNELIELNRQYHDNGKLVGEVDHALSECGVNGEHWEPAKARAAIGDPQSPLGKLAEWGRNRFGPAFDQETFATAESPREALLIFGRDLIRRELTALERFVMLQIYDQAWKEHMRAIEMLKEAIGLRSFAEQDPRIAYKREGFQMFQEMMNLIKDKVTGIIFRARLSTEAELQSRYRISAAQHADATNQGFAAGSAGVDRDRAAAMQAQGEQKVETIRREKPRVGRNEPCPCGSGKKYKQCCGKGQ